jgi:hypothetical protein
MAYRVTVRAGPKVERHEAARLDEALEVVEREARAAAAGPRRESVDLRMRTFEPVQQVATRIEVRGPGALGGVDVRGDGSIEAFIGRWRRRVVEQHPRETPYAALRRALISPRTSAGP